MNYAQLNERISVLMRVNSSLSTTGQDEWTYTQRLSCWAKVEQISAGEAVVDDRVVSAVVKQFTVRTECTVSNSDRISFKNQEYEVVALDNTVNKMYTKVTAKLIV